MTGRLTTDVGEGSISEQLVIRFRGPDDLIASGHPPAGEALPPALGMIASKDAGKTWTGLGEVGRNDFHAIQIAGELIVAGVYGEPSVTVSRDGGRTFESSTPPETLVDLEVDPDDPKRWVASTFEELVVTEDEGDSWRPVEPIPNVRFAWPAGDTLYRVDPGGPVKVSADGGRTWEDRGSTGGEPQAMFADVLPSTSTSRSSTAPSRSPPTAAGPGRTASSRPPARRLVADVYSPRPDRAGRARIARSRSASQGLPPSPSHSSGSRRSPRA